MKKLTLTPLLAVLATGSLTAETATVKEESFTAKSTLTATLLPAEVTPIAIHSDAWTSFIIQEIAPQGALVAKGDTLIRFDPTDYDKKLRDAQSADAASQLTLANAEADYAAAEKYNPMQLQSSRLKHEEAQEAWTYFQKTRRDAEIRDTNLTLRAAELRLDSEREELAQLEKMYKADDLTENTEEIILKRQRESVKFSEAALDSAKLDHKRKLDILLPREAIALEREAQSTAIALREHEASIPRSLELKRIALEDARVKATRDAHDLAQLKAAQPHFTITAPAAGHFYHGTIQDGRWTITEATKALTPENPAPVNRPFATFIPAAAPLRAEAFVDEATHRQLAKGQKGYARFSGAAQTSHPATILHLHPTPSTDSRYRVTLDLALPDAAPIVPGMTATATIITYHKEKTLTLPTKALHTANDGTWEVEIKEEGEGKTTKRIPITRGPSSGDKVEILNGLTKDQQVILP